MSSHQTASAVLTEAQRMQILSSLSNEVQKRFYDTRVSKIEWPANLEKFRSPILNSPSNEAFEHEVMQLLSSLGSSHVGFYHSDLNRCSAKMALCAAYAAFPCEDGEWWVFQDVHEGGPAAKAGIRAGDVLIGVNGQDFRPPRHPSFVMPSTASVTFLTRNGEATRIVTIPKPKQQRSQLPQIEPDPIVCHRRLNSDTGYVRLAMYPGNIGVDVANDIHAAISALGRVNRLIIDLRGNTGGGVGFLRLLSFLTPDRVTVGIFRKGRLRSYSGSDARHAFVFDRIPRSRWMLYPLTVKFFSFVVIRKMLRQRLSIQISTEGLGPQPFHSRVVILADRHSASANEMLIAFARDNKLATIVGEPTPGRMLGAEKFKLPHGYQVALPVGSYRTDSGENLEGSPIAPDVFAPFNPVSARNGTDSQLDVALATVSRL